MFKNRKEIKISAIQISILSIIAILIGICGIVIFSLFVKEFNILLLAILLALSILDIVIPLLVLSAFLLGKIERKQKFSDSFRVIFTSKNDTFQIAECIGIITILVVVLIILVLIF